MEYELYHHGVKGMKWGVRKKRESSPSKRAIKKALRKETDAAIKKARADLKKGDLSKRYTEAEDAVYAATTFEGRQKAERALKKIDHEIVNTVELANLQTSGERRVAIALSTVTFASLTLAALGFAIDR